MLLLSLITRLLLDRIVSSYQGVSVRSIEGDSTQPVYQSGQSGDHHLCNSLQLIVHARQLNKRNRRTRLDEQWLRTIKQIMYSIRHYFNGTFNYSCSQLSLVFKIASIQTGSTRTIVALHNPKQLGTFKIIALVYDYEVVVEVRSQCMSVGKLCRRQPEDLARSTATGQLRAPAETTRHEVQCSRALAPPPHRDLAVYYALHTTIYNRMTCTRQMIVKLNDTGTREVAPERFATPCGLGRRSAQNYT